MNKTTKAYLENNDDLSKSICLLSSHRYGKCHLLPFPSPLPPLRVKCPLPSFPTHSPTLDADDLLSRKSSKSVAWVIAHYYGNQFGASIWIPILKCNYAKMCTYASNLLKRNLFPIEKKMFPVLDERAGWGGTFIFFSVRLNTPFNWVSTLSGKQLALGFSLTTFVLTWDVPFLRHFSLETCHS